MTNKSKHYPVNWIDGMKINKDHFIAQENAFTDALHDVLSLNLSPLRYGVLQTSPAACENFNVKISLDNQSILRVNIISCQAVTPGGVLISVPAVTPLQTGNTNSNEAVSLAFKTADAEITYWVVLSVNPFDRIPAGNPDPSETPPRFPHVIAPCTVQLVGNSQYKQFAYNPYSIVIGKINVKANEAKVEEDYIPPCYSVNAHVDLLSLHGEIDQFLSNLERKCTQIVQKIFKKNQQNDLSQLVSFLCDRIMLYVGPAITDLRYLTIYEAPIELFLTILSIGRVMKNTIDFHLGSGKEELMNYLSEWCDLNQGDLENMLNSLSALQYDHNNINGSIREIGRFISVTSKLFDTLSNLEFIGKRRDTGIFIKEENKDINVAPNDVKPKRRFFG